jgi:TolA-binding protein
MTESLSLKRSLLNEWLTDTQLCHTKKRKAFSSSSSLPASSSSDEIRSPPSSPLVNTANTTTLKKRKISRLDGLERKVQRLSTDNTQLKQCAHVLEMQHNSALSETLSKQARIAALEEQLAAAQRLLLLQRTEESVLVSL